MDKARRKLQKILRNTSARARGLSMVSECEKLIRRLFPEPRSAPRQQGVLQQGVSKSNLTEPRLFRADQGRSKVMPERPLGARANQ